MSGSEKPPESLNELLDRVGEEAENREEVSVADLMAVAGRRSFGPLLLLVGTVAAAPGVGDIPGAATLMGALILLVSVQLLFGRKDFWLPGWILKRKASSGRVTKMAETKWLRKPASWIDRAATERLSFLAGPGATRGIAVATTLMALLLPMTEVVPFGTAVLSLSLIAYGISMIANDGLMALIGMAISAAAFYLVIRSLM